MDVLLHTRDDPPGTRSALEGWIPEKGTPLLGSIPLELFLWPVLSMISMEYEGALGSIPLDLGLGGDWILEGWIPEQPDIP